MAIQKTPYLCTTRNLIRLKFIRIGQLTKSYSTIAHIQTTLDFENLDFSGTIRETTARMENMMSTARNGSTQNPVTSSSRASSSSNVSVSSEVIQRSHTSLH